MDRDLPGYQRGRPPFVRGASGRWRRALSRGAAVASVALALAALACAPRVPPPDLAVEPAPLLAQVEAAQARVLRVQGPARVHVDAPGMSGTVNQFIAAEKPDRIHVEVLDFFGNVAAVLAAADGRFALYDARAKVYYRGAATPENLARLVPLPLPAEDLVTILCGSAPVRAGDPERVEPGHGVARLVLRDGARVQTVEVGEKAAVVSSRQRVDGALPPGGYDLEFDGFRTRGGVRFPTDVSLRATRPKVALEIHWSSAVEVNGDVDAALFRLEPPRGARIVDLARPGQEPPPELLRRDLAPAVPDPAGGRRE